MTKSYNFISLSDTISNILVCDLLDFGKVDEIYHILINDLSKYGLEGQTALHLAIAHSETEMCKLSLSHPDIKDAKMTDFFVI